MAGSFECIEQWSSTKGRAIAWLGERLSPYGKKFCSSELIIYKDWSGYE
jgi:hypothetical protein